MNQSIDQSECAATGSHYLFGSDLVSPYGVQLNIDTAGLTADKFMTDMPRIIAKLQTYVLQSINQGRPVS